MYLYDNVNNDEDFVEYDLDFNLHEVFPENDHNIVEEDSPLIVNQRVSRFGRVIRTPLPGSSSSNSMALPAITIRSNRYKRDSKHVRFGKVSIKSFHPDDLCMEEFMSLLPGSDNGLGASGDESRLVDSEYDIRGDHDMSIADVKEEDLRGATILIQD